MMQRFLIKIFLFLVPIIMLIVWTISYYTFEQGDLTRMSYLKIDYDYSKIFGDEYVKYHSVIYNDSSVVKKKKWKFFTIGDSFTQQSKIGYVNKLSAKFPNDVVSFKSKYQHEGDVISTAYGLASSDYFDSVKVEYVILQCVERYIVYRGVGLNKELQLSYASIEEKNKESKKEIIPTKEPFATDRFIKFPLNNIMYLFNTNGHNGQVYKEELTKQLFSVKTNDVLFFNEDVSLLYFNNNSKNIKHLNDNLNDLAGILSEKGIKLIVLIAPDKFDLYYPYIKNNKKYKKPIFFEQFNSLAKNYLYLDTYQLLRQQLEQNTKDLYLYDDTHWSPWATELIATKIIEITK